MKEKKTRGRYKQYLYDPDVKIPISTQNDHKRENNLLLNKSVNQEQEKEKTINQQKSSNEFLIITSDNLVEELETIQSESESSDEIEEEKEDDLINYNLKNIIQDKDITKDELAAAFLAAFFNGKITQSSLTDFLQLSNIISPIKLPTTFDGLIKVVNGEKPNLMVNKTWYCSICLEKTTKLDDRFQRACKKCKSK
jgi:hypothetical protein